MPRKASHRHWYSRIYRAFLKWLILLLTTSVLLLVSLILVLRFIDPPTWSWKIQRELSPPTSYPIESRHQWQAIDHIAPAMQLAVVAAEDQKFPDHHGIDFEAIQDALRDAENGKLIRGASTLTQQTVKNLFLWQNRDWSRKLLEGGLALLLELLWDKRRILEVYLNIVEFGPGIYGVGAASEYWFQVSADRLTVNQAARLAAILPNPWRYQAQPPTPYVVERAVWIEQQMEQLGYVWLISVTGW
ncbi:MAG: monofunctional biosynthetic peptidoglycan transglycosylase [Candidatus Thiodiazotropha sp.]|nr:monofunctional biosynthetic peptidoglycan transglycosylase [Candidatus Thiodiazotropha sp.]MCM8885628.1 monofunctional biosynthetic peptidoglycan transglycosylase [Candidatus Thiodiazotropha sp.]MCM8922198.1 monofunctional biosynthetic peptidoglycan transglycosylase [Candidatus Thiodiazotropha sp.]MCU7871455.1 monofunctional biosynthetic peptidoglycan transglycosylase [Candidatus Thiodiazotropha sp. (ex Lucinoma borealis)]